MSGGADDPITLIDSAPHNATDLMMTQGTMHWATLSNREKGEKLAECHEACTPHPCRRAGGSVTAVAIAPPPPRSHNSG